MNYCSSLGHERDDHEHVSFGWPEGHGSAVQTVLMPTESRWIWKEHFSGFGCRYTTLEDKSNNILLLTGWIIEYKLNKYINELITKWYGTVNVRFDRLETWGPGV